MKPDGWQIYICEKASDGFLRNGHMSKRGNVNETVLAKQNNLASPGMMDCYVTETVVVTCT